MKKKNGLCEENYSKRQNTKSFVVAYILFTAVSGWASSKATSAHVVGVGRESMDFCGRYRKLLQKASEIDTIKFVAEAVTPVIKFSKPEHIAYTQSDKTA